MGGGGGSSTPSQTTQFNPWKGQKPYLLDIYNQAQQQFNNPQQYYPGSTVAPQDEATIAAQNAAEARARAGSPLLGSAQATNLATTRGDYLDPASNPWLTSTYDAAAAGVRRNFDLSVLPALDSRFANAGRLGSGAYGAGLSEAARGLGENLGNVATSIYGGNYQSERDRQMGAVAAAPDLANADYTDINALGGVGAARQGFSQQQLQDLIDRFNFAQQEPANALARYSSIVGAPVGGSATAFGNTKRGGQLGWGLVGAIV
jgi:hypothetical protein